MEDIGDFTLPVVTQQRSYNKLSTGYSYLEQTDLAYAKVTPCFENGKGLIGADLEGPTFATTEVTVLRPNPGVPQRFLAYVIQSQDFRSEAIASMTGAGGLRRVSESEMKNFRAPAPDVATQHQIADYLDHETAEIDAAIVDQSSLMSLIRERQFASIDRAYQEAALRGKQLRPVKYSFDINPTVKYSAKQLPQDSVYLPMSAIGEFGEIDISWSRPTAEMVNGYTYVENGDVIIAKVTPCFENGKGAVISSLPGGVGFATTEVTNFRSMGSALPHYLAVVLRTSRFRANGESEMTGAGGLRRVPDRYMANFKIAELNTGEQRELIQHVEKIDRRSEGLVQDLDKAINFARERRAALITAAVTGQIDVTARNKPAAEQLEDDIAQGFHREN